MRLFVAINLPEAIEMKLEEFQHQLKPFARDAKWVNPFGIHLTLKFLGEVKPEQVPEVHKAFEESAQEFGPVNVVVKGCGFFPNERRPAVFWVGVEGDSLKPLQQSMEERFALQGFEKENREYSPHLTLARFRDPHGRLPLVHEANKRKTNGFGDFTASEFHLYQSVLKRTGAEYTILKSFSLRRATKTPSTPS
ncbi:RNA 2',3'-cyclic phosphodiesterase [bacterium]|nr:RNA 2',3'-cyclic phosphodiesterase [bacterium]